MTVIDALRTMTAYPVPDAVLNRVLLRRGLSAADEMTADTMDTEAYELACADVMIYLSTAPSVSQNGISFSVSAEVQQRLRNQADGIYRKYGNTAAGRVKFGYVGSRL